MTKTQDIEAIAQLWIERAKSCLLGRTIVDIVLLPKADAQELRWYFRPIVLLLDDGSYLYPVADEEENDAGALATGYDDLPIIPRIRG